MAGYPPLRVGRKRRCDVLTDERLSELQHEATDVIAALDSALEDPRFKLTVAVLVIARNRNSREHCVEGVNPGASDAK